VAGFELASFTVGCDGAAPVTKEKESVNKDVDRAEAVIDEEVVPLLSFV